MKNTKDKNEEYERMTNNENRDSTKKNELKKNYVGKSATKEIQENIRKR